MKGVSGPSGFTLRFLFLVALGFLVLLAASLYFLGYRPLSSRDPVDPKRLVTIIAPRGEVASAPREFSWARDPGAHRYKVTISDDDAVWPLFVRNVDATSLLLTEKEALALTPGRIHVWEVQALDELGASVATGSVRFLIPPPTAP